MSRIDRALRRRLERREKRRSARLETDPESNLTSTQSPDIVGHGWAVHKHGHSIQWLKADDAADTAEE